MLGSTAVRSRLVVITGAAGGIGRATAIRLAHDGAAVLCADIDGAGVEQTVAEIRRAELRAEAVCCDVASTHDVQQLMSEAQRAGGPQALICNAAVDFSGAVEDTSPEDWARVLSINLGGVYLCARAAIPLMRGLGGGSIVTVASVNGFWLEPELAAYAAAKGGVIALTRAIAIDAGRDGIRCNCVCPGYIDTGMAQRYFDAQTEPVAAREQAGRMHALGRIGRPEEVAAVISFLASDESSFCTGQPFIVDGGLSAGIPAADAG